MSQDFIRRNSADSEKKLHTEVVDVPGLGQVHRLAPALNTQVDAVTDLLLYIGKAPIGTLTNEAKWQVRKLTLTSLGGVLMQWADGNGDFDNVWDNRASLSYS